MNNLENQESLYSIAVVGMAGRFPGARNIDEFWTNLCNGVESISTFSDAEIEDELERQIAIDPNYVRARAILDHIDLFDAAFFGFSPREAAIMDPQHRLFLEYAWDALEHAGYNPETYDGSIGVFASTQMSSYLLSNLYPNREVLKSAGLLAIRIANDRDFLPTRVSYKFNLRGPSLCIQTACSSSLVACHIACQNLLDYQCDMALVGGVSINTPQKLGYLYQVGGIYSPDGHCRAFDAQAQGTVTGSGLGVVVLKRLEDALAAGDTIHAVIKGSAVNNDGFLKVGYTAPSVQGQAEVIAAAQAIAGVDPETIHYIEAHGTGTALGDPVEVGALTQVFRQSTNKRGFCAIGSVKSNIGHLDAAAGVASLIKTVLTLKHRFIPPSLNCSDPNPEINFPSTPFYVSTQPTEWQAGNLPRRAGVSSFGVGGTNAHVVLEEAPSQSSSEKVRSRHVLMLSAKTESALEQQTEKLLAHLKQADLNLADVAFTLHVGRKAFEHRRILVCQDLDEAVQALKARTPQRVFSAVQPVREQAVAFLFPGQGAQYVNMGRELYQTEATFRQTVDRCSESLKPHLGLDLRTVLYPDETQAEAASLQLQQTFITQPALFVVEYALATLWMDWGIHPQSMIGHSIGEYVAACLAGVFSLNDALMLVATRGRLMQNLPSGAMLAVSLTEQEVQPWLDQSLSLAVVNGSAQCVVAGLIESIEAFQAQLTSKGIDCRRLRTSHAFHSAAMEPILQSFAAQVQQVSLQPPQIPYVSNLTGTWITAQEATDPYYWVKHLRQTVRFAEGITTLLQTPDGIALEVGPGRTLTTLIRHHSPTATSTLLTSLRHPREPQSDVEFLLTTLGKLWLAGALINWQGFYAAEQRHRLPLPTYPFERQRYWIDPPNKIAERTGRSTPIPLGEAPAIPTPPSQQSRTQFGTTYTAPRNAIEQAIARLWQELLGIENIGIYDNFFELGGHSLLATQVVSRLRDSQGIEISLNTLFEAATIAELAHQVETELHPNFSNNSQLSILPTSRSNIALPLSFAQQRLWFLHQIDPANTAYNLPFAVRLTGILDLAVLELSFSEIVRRHEVLRTQFITIEGKPSQVIIPPQPLLLSVMNLETIPGVKQESEVQRLLHDLAQQPFDLSQDSLMRIRVLRLNTAEHVVCLTLHHIIADGWSIGILIQELVTLYQAFAAQQPSPLPELPIQYVDFAHWQRQYLSGEVLERQLDYWKQQLAGIPPLLELPADRPRPPERTFQGGTIPMELNADLMKQLKSLSQQSGTTLFMTLLAAFSALLSRYSGQEDIVVGSPIANRNRGEIESLIGFFVNTLVLRVQLQDNPSFEEVLKQVRQVSLDAYTHQDMPFEQLVEALRPERNLTNSPLFQVMFVLQNAPMGELELPGVNLTPIEGESVIAKFDLTLFLGETAAGLKGRWEYNSDLFEAATIERMSQHFQNLLEAIVANPQLRVAQLPLLSEAERQQFLVEWNDTQTDYPQDKAIHQLFEEQVERSPDAVAVVFEEKQLTYRELNARANQLAHYLQTLGVGPEELVGICVERSLDLVVGLLGILKAGGAYVPLDPTYPSDRLAYLLDDAQVKVLLAQQKLVNFLPDFKGQILCLDSQLEQIAEKPTINPIREVNSDNLVYAIYTSGSTGKPKGVMNIHQGLVNRLLWMQEAYQLSEADRVLQKTPFSFDVSVWEFFWPLISGAVLVVARPGGHQDSAYLVNIIVEQRITTLHFVPCMLQVFLEEKGLENCRSLRRVICSGESLTFELQQRFFDRLDCELHNLYGPTEAAIDVTYWRCKPGNKLGKVLIGRPIANTQIYLLDSYLQPVPLGVPGELHIGGVGLARGYLNRPDLTAEKFISNPFDKSKANSQKSKLYKTGDLARYLPDGNIEYLGRIDNQVKVRGFRIELGEIEAVLSQHPRVREAVVLARETEYRSGSKQLVAYIVPKLGEREACSVEVRAFLVEKLPDYMLPSAFVMLDALPLTSNGKVDRPALPAPVHGERKQSGADPRNAIEAQLAAIWSKVLRVESIGIHDDFFEVGGDSILSIQIVAKANQAGLHLTPKHLFEHRTIAGLATVAGTVSSVQAEQGLITGAVPLTPIQHWFFEQVLLHPHHWNQAVLFAAPPSIEPSKLAQALNHLLFHHDALRLRFAQDEQGWQQTIANMETTVPFTSLDLSLLSEAKQRSTIETHVAALQTSLDLAQGPLLQMALFNLGVSKPGRLLIVIHHLAVDGVSWRILLDDLQTVYLQLVQGESLVLPAKTTSFKQWAGHLHAYAKSDALEQERDYWLSRTCQSITSLPTDLPNSEAANTVASSQVVSVTLTPDETRTLLLDVPRAYHTEINDVLLTALVQTLMHWTGSRSLWLDLEGHGREEIGEALDLSRTVGWFTTVFPVFIDLDGITTLGEALKSVKEQLRRIPNRGIGYGVLRYLCPNPAALQIQELPPARVSFNYLGQLDLYEADRSLFQLAPESVGATRSLSDVRRHWLEINGSLFNGQLQVELTYSQNLHHHSTIEQIAQGFMERLRSLIVHCQTIEGTHYTPSDFSDEALSEAELDIILGQLSLSN